MVYPHSPFSDKLDDLNFEKNFKWLCSPPQVASFRVNSLKARKKEMFESLKESLADENVKCSIDENVEDTIIVQFSSNNLIRTHLKEVVIDNDCGAAVLRGAHIFAPGILGMVSGCQKGDLVSIYVDLMKTCKKGLQKIFTGSKIHVGNGIVRMPRSELFAPNLNPSGIAVQVIETTSGCPQISENMFPKGAVLLQNLPSIICVQTLNPQPNETVLDMCAAPGHKTSHIAALMNNQGNLIAIDKTPGKAKLLSAHCLLFDAKVNVFVADSTKIFSVESLNAPADGPPFPKESFDKILLDAPCSALGKRPQFRNDITSKVLKSYVSLQKKLFSTAVNLLKVNGILVYSTCTITLNENEGIVAWALEKFDLELVRSKVHLGSPGYGGKLTPENSLLVQRFGPNSGMDSIGFFIAAFRKKS